MKPQTAHKKAVRDIKYAQGQIRTLAKELFRLAPPPGRSGHHGPVFISLNTAFNPVSEHEGLLGTIIMESFLGGAFSQAAANDNSLANNYADMTIEYFDQRLEERETHNNQGRGRGSIALYERKIRPAARPDEREQTARAYHRDLPRRKNIESHIAALLRDNLLHDTELHPALTA